jgi:hypothetical protein
MKTFDNIIELTDPAIELYITPLSPYFICDHFISTEIHYSSGVKFVDYNLKLKANDLLKNKNYDDIKNFDILQVQVDHFDFFYDEVLAILVKNNKTVIIITSQLHRPQLEKSYKTYELLNHKNNQELDIEFVFVHLHRQNKVHLHFQFIVLKDFLL